MVPANHLWLCHREPVSKPAVTQAKPGVRAEPAVLRYIASRTLTNFGGGVTTAIGPLLAALVFDANARQMGLIISTAMVVSALIRLPVARQIDRLRDERRVMVIGGLIAAAASAVVPLLWLANVLTFWTFLVAITGSTVISVTLQAAGFRMINQLTHPGNRTTITGWLNSASGVGGMAGQSVGAGLLQVLSAPLAMLLTPVAMVAGVALLPKPARPEPTTAESDAPAVEQPQEPVQPPRIWTTIRQVLSLPYLVLAVLVGVAGSFVEPVLVLFSLRVAHVPPGLYGLGMALGAVGGILGGLIVGPLFNRVGFWAGFAIGTASMAVGTALMVLLGPLPGFGFAALVVLELTTAAGGTVVMVGAYGRLQEQAPPDSIATMMSAASLGMELTGVAGIALAAVIADHVGLAAGFWISLACYALVLVGMAITMAHGRGRSSEPAP